jgi:hypothetical protein
MRSNAACGADRSAKAEIARLAGDLATFRTQLDEATAAVKSERNAHADTRPVLLQRALDVERLTRQVRDLGEHVGFRQSIEEKAPARARSARPAASNVSKKHAATSSRSCSCRPSCAS